MIPEREREALMRLTMCAREECGVCKYKDTCNFEFQYEIATENMNILAEALRKTEATISKMEQVDKDINVRSKYESTTQTETQNSNLTFEKRKCIDCNFLTYMFGKTWCNIKCENPHDKVCDRFKPKDEPQTDCSWRKPND